MAFNPLPGKGASVMTGTSAYAFDEWKSSIKNHLAEVSNFTGAGFRQYVSCLTDAKITLSGPYDEGNMPFTAGNSYALILGYTSGISLTVTALLESIDPDVKVDDAERISLTFQSNGTFSALIA